MFFSSASGLQKKLDHFLGLRWPVQYLQESLAHRNEELTNQSRGHLDLGDDVSKNKSCNKILDILALLAPRGAWLRQKSCQEISCSRLWWY
jgi:hypothetical protein